MSSLPGLTLEAYVAWNYDLVVVDDASEVNPSLGIAEVLGNAPRRRRVTKAELAEIVSHFEPYREPVENWLMDFDDESQSWRDYAAHGPVPKEVFESADV